eukprot:12315390-Alexandrium_andersonii.AAC.1
MSASLVGSEMCIRDRACPYPARCRSPHVGPRLDPSCTSVDRTRDCCFRRSKLALRSPGARSSRR